MNQPSSDSDPHFNVTCDGRRWLGYFDLLGIKNQVVAKSTMDVFSIYDYVIREAFRATKHVKRIKYAWFSDTFLFFAKDDSAASFAEMDQVCRWFAYFLVFQEIPFRGAMACGEFYADTAHNIFLGKALVEAYQAVEKLAFSDQACKEKRCP